MIGEHAPPFRNPTTSFLVVWITYLVPDVPVCAPGDDLATIWASLRAHPFRTVDDIAVCETATDGSRRLVGLIPIEKLCAAGDTQGRRTDGPDPGVVVGYVAHERAAWKAVHHGESVLEWRLSDGRFRGLIPPSRLLLGLLQGHDGTCPTRRLSRVDGVGAARIGGTAAAAAVSSAAWLNGRVLGSLTKSALS